MKYVISFPFFSVICLKITFRCKT